MPPPFEVIVDRSDNLARVFASRLKDAQRAGASTLAVPGGSVAEQFFPVLASANLEWRRLHQVHAAPRYRPWAIRQARAPESGVPRMKRVGYRANWM